MAADLSAILLTSSRTDSTLWLISPVDRAETARERLDVVYRQSIISNSITICISVAAIMGALALSYIYSVLLKPAVQLRLLGFDQLHYLNHGVIIRGNNMGQRFIVPGQMIRWRLPVKPCWKI